VEPHPLDGFRHIACCVEDTEGSRLALAQAAAIRSLSGGRLTVLHVVAPPPGLDPAASLVHAQDAAVERSRAWLDALCADHPEAEPQLLLGPAEPELVCDWARHNGVDLLVAGGLRRRLDRTFKGDFAAILTRRAPCSVLVARPSR
jgi:nucleotide-binding universal stress UspA family protein